MKRYQAQFALLAALLISFAVSQLSGRMNDYYLDIVLTAGISVILAVSLNLVNGHTGQFSLGHAGFMAVGAYGAAIVSIELGPQLQRIFGSGDAGSGVSFLFALLTGGICAALCGWIVGVPSLRLRGDYLAIVTLGFNEIIRVILQNTKPDGVFGGALGLGRIPSTTSIFWAFGAAAVCIYVVSSMINSTWGRGFLAVRDDEHATVPHWELLQPSRQSTSERREDLRLSTARCCLHEQAIKSGVQRAGNRLKTFQLIRPERRPSNHLREWCHFFPFRGALVFGGGRSASRSARCRSRSTTQPDVRQHCVTC